MTYYFGEKIVKSAEWDSDSKSMRVVVEVEKVKEKIKSLNR